jgi:Na+-driven multidrug efflux pump
LATGFVTSLVLGLALQVFHQPILGLFSQDPRVVALARPW